MPSFNALGGWFYTKTGGYGWVWVWEVGEVIVRQTQGAWSLSLVGFRKIKTRIGVNNKANRAQIEKTDIAEINKISIIGTMLRYNYHGSSQLNLRQKVTNNPRRMM